MFIISSEGTTDKVFQFLRIMLQHGGFLYTRCQGNEGITDKGEGRRKGRAWAISAQPQNLEPSRARQNSPPGYLALSKKIRSYRLGFCGFFAMPEHFDWTPLVGLTAKSCAGTCPTRGTGGRADDFGFLLFHVIVASLGFGCLYWSSYLWRRQTPSLTEDRRHGSDFGDSAGGRSCDHFRKLLLSVPSSRFSCLGSKLANPVQVANVNRNRNIGRVAVVQKMLQPDLKRD